MESGDVLCRMSSAYYDIMNFLWLCGLALARCPGRPGMELWR